MHKTALRRALAMGPGTETDAALSAALAQDGTLLEDEAYSDWPWPRDALELLRQEARLKLARERTQGPCWSQPQR